MKVRGILGQLFDLRRRSFVAIRTRARIFPHVRIALALALSFTACSSKSEAPPPPPPPPPAPADAALDLTKPCLPSSLADANVAYVRSDGPRVTACYGNGDDTPGSVTHCLVIDESGEVLGPRAWADADKARLAARELPQPVDVEVAEDVTKPGVATYDKTRAFVFDEVEVDGKKSYRGRFYDLRTNKQIGDVDLAKLDPDNGTFTLPHHVREARWVGKRVIVTDREEVGPTYHAYLLSSSGEHLALADQASSYEVIDDQLIAVITRKQIALVDTTKLRTIGTHLAPGKDSPNGDLRIARFSDQLVVAYARPPGVFFVDRATHETIHERTIPICR
jgi:hypothetical protein